MTSNKAKYPQQTTHIYTNFIQRLFNAALKINNIQ